MGTTTRALTLRAASVSLVRVHGSQVSCGTEGDICPDGVHLGDRVGVPGVVDREFVDEDRVPQVVFRPGMHEYLQIVGRDSFDGYLSEGPGFYRGHDVHG